MKYMSFNSSCAYAGVSNMLERFGVDTDDRTIALEMGLPYLFSREDGGFAAGPMLQSARWFNLYLHPLGFHMVEQTVPASQVPDFLKPLPTAMLGIRVGNAGKHALTYTGYGEDGFHFLNNKWRQEDSPDKLTFTAAELAERTDETCMVAFLQEIPPTEVDLREEMIRSMKVLEENLREIEKISKLSLPAASLREKMNSLFRPLLLDGITMLDLLGEGDLKEQFVSIQRSFLMALREDDPQLRLCDHISLEALEHAAAQYLNLIRQKLDR